MVLRRTNRAAVAQSSPKLKTSYGGDKYKGRRSPIPTWMLAALILVGTIGLLGHVFRKVGWREETEAVWEWYYDYFYEDDAVVADDAVAEEGEEGEDAYEYEDEEDPAPAFSLVLLLSVHFVYVSARCTLTCYAVLASVYCSCHFSSISVLCTLVPLIYLFCDPCLCTHITYSCICLACSATVST